MLFREDFAFFAVSFNKKFKFLVKKIQGEASNAGNAI